MELHIDEKLKQFTNYALIIHKAAFLVKEIQTFIPKTLEIACWGQVS